MRDFGQIQSSFWTDQSIQSMPDYAVRLACYLLTGPHTNSLGCFRLADGYVMEDLNWNSSTVSKGFDELFQNGFCNRCQSTKIIIIYNFLRWNPIANPNVGKKILKDVSSLDKKFSLINDLEKQLKRFGNHLPNGYETVLKGFRNPNLSKPILTEPEPDPILAEEGGSEKSSNALFEKFWTEYPKKRKKGDAEKAWKKIKPSEQLVETMISVINRAKTSKDWTKDGGQYIPYPASWLNGAGWEDEFEELTETKTGWDLLTEKYTEKVIEGEVIGH